MGIFLVETWAFGDASLLQGMPTFVRISVSNGNDCKENRKITDIWTSKIQSGKYLKRLKA